ncbi:major histocompatibility complex class I-related gene protein-like [Thamnophis elegans]|uniref:major histocompatibility complex class I-related gene protein-like n=1 Tax=Thamnophis elegans TaxID=35005 RepID=UPI0013784952|nr:major histocompatibility complex class I-related gene protein-like [Thamnophis elegans]
MEAEEVKIPERMFRADLEWLSNRNPQTGGLHTWQLALGCELIEDGSKGGFLHYGYNGMDFISFDKETLRWVTAQPQAQKVKEEWEEDPRWSQGIKDFLEKTCILWLQTYLPHQKEALKKTEPPVGNVTRKVVDDSLEVLICQAFGFYPKEIRSTWMRDGEVCQYETLHKNVAPNSDGTYYVQLSIDIDPKERNRFQCHLEHEGLQEPLVLAWEEETDMLLFHSVGVVMIIILGAVILFLICCWRKNRKNLPQTMTTCLNHLSLEKRFSSSTFTTEDGIQSQVMFPPKMTSEGGCGEKTELREGKKRLLKASPDAYSDKVEGAALEISEEGSEERLEDADAPKPGMEGLEEEVSPGTSEGPSEEQPVEHLAGEERGETQLQLEGSQTQPEAQDGEGFCCSLSERMRRTC